MSRLLRHAALTLAAVAAIDAALIAWAVADRAALTHRLRKGEHR